MAVNVELAYEYPERLGADEFDEEYEDRIKRTRIANKRRKNAANVRTFMAALIVATLFVIMTYGKVELSKLYSEYAAMESELAVLKSENVSLESELAQQTGLTKVEDYAEEQLGLQKLDKSQIEYVEIKEDTAAAPVAAEETNIFVKIMNWWYDVLEYLGL